MKYVRRTLEQEIRRAVAHFPAVLVTGPRRSGKTTLHTLLEAGTSRDTPVRP